MNTRKHILARVEAFLRLHGLTAARFGLDAVGDHKFVKRLTEGAGITLTVIERAEAYMASVAPTDAMASHQHGSHSRRRFVSMLPRTRRLAQHCAVPVPGEEQLST